MIWIFLLILLGIITFTSLGAMSVWVTILTGTIKVLAIVLSAGLLYFAYKHFFGRKA